MPLTLGQNIERLLCQPVPVHDALEFFLVDRLITHERRDPGTIQVRSNGLESGQIPVRYLATSYQQVEVYVLNVFQQLQGAIQIYLVFAKCT